MHIELKILTVEHHDVLQAMTASSSSQIKKVKLQSFSYKCKTHVRLVLQVKIMLLYPISTVKLGERIIRKKNTEILEHHQNRNEKY